MLIWCFDDGGRKHCLIHQSFISYRCLTVLRSGCCEGHSLVDMNSSVAPGKEMSHHKMLFFPTTWTSGPKLCQLLPYNNIPLYVVVNGLILLINLRMSCFDTLSKLTKNITTCMLSSLISNPDYWCLCQSSKCRCHCSY